MTLLVTHLWPALLAALALGLGVGWFSCAKETSRAARVWALAAALTFAVGCAAAMLALTSGRAGLWLETALLLGGLYLAGCCLGCLLGRWLRAKPAIHFEHDPVNPTG